MGSISRFLAYLFVFQIRVLSKLVNKQCQIDYDGNQCVELTSGVCLSGVLTYNQTSLKFTPNYGLDEVMEKLSFWENLKNIPKCWDVVRPVLCGVYLPRCEWDNMLNKSVIQHPGKDWCETMKDSCKIVEELEMWPEYLKCNYSHFEKGCLKSAEEIKFQSSGQCAFPLIRTNNQRHWYPGFEGCGLRCENPWFTDEDHARIHFIIFVLGICCVLCNLFVVLTFSFNWKQLNIFPDNIILYINVCHLLSSCGWLAQFVPGARKDINCNEDGSVRRADTELKYKEAVPCATVFILIYYFTLASAAWFVVLSYTWQVAFEKSRKQVKKKKTYYHLGVWVTSFVLTVSCLVFTRLDGNTVTGICFISLENFYHRAIFVLSPVAISWITGLAYLVKGLYLLVNMKSQSPDLLTKQKRLKLRSSIIRIGIFASLLLLLGVTIIGLHIHTLINFSKWNKSLRNYIICKSNLTDEHKTIEECSLENKPNTAVIQTGVFCFFSIGILMSSWLWTMAAIKSWRHCFQRVFRKFDKYRNRKTTVALQKDRSSTTSGVETEDLIGMNFDLSSMTSFDVSSLSSVFSSRLRRYSDSDISFTEKLRRHPRKTPQLLRPRQNVVESIQGGSSLSSSEWSAGESQKSHCSVDVCLQERIRALHKESTPENDSGCGSSVRPFEQLGITKITRDAENSSISFEVKTSSISAEEVILDDSMKNKAICKEVEDKNNLFNNKKVEDTIIIDLNNFRNKTNALFDMVEETVCSRGRDNDMVEETVCSRGCDNDMVEETVCSRGCDNDMVGETVCSRGRDHDMAEETVCSRGRDHDMAEETVCSKGRDHHMVEETFCSRGHDHDMIVNTEDCCSSSNEVSNDSDTVNSSNSNYTLASSDTSVLSIKLDKNYQPICNSVESLNYPESNFSSNPCSNSQLVNVSVRKKPIESIESVSRKDVVFPLPAMTLPMLTEQQYWLPYRFDYQHLYSNRLANYCLDLHNPILFSDQLSHSHHDENHIPNDVPDNVLDNVELYSLESSSSENGSLVSIDQKANDGDESDLSDNFEPAKNSKRNVLKRRERSQTMKAKLS